MVISPKCFFHRCQTSRQFNTFSFSGRSKNADASFCSEKYFPSCPQVPSSPPSLAVISRQLQHGFLYLAVPHYSTISNFVLSSYPIVILTIFCFQLDWSDGFCECSRTTGKQSLRNHHRRTHVHPGHVTPQPRSGTDTPWRCNFLAWFSLQACAEHRESASLTTAQWKTRNIERGWQNQILQPGHRNIGDWIGKAWLAQRIP